MKYLAEHLSPMTVAITSILIAGGCDQASEGPTDDVCYVDRDEVPACTTTLDLHLPEPSTQSAPVMVMVHGGGWESGDKADTEVTANQVPWFTGQGWIYVSVNYRLAPQVEYDKMARDVAASVRWLQKNVASYGGDPNQISLMGHEAGAHLVALATLDHDYFEAERVSGQRPVKSLSLYNGLAFDVRAVMNSTGDTELRRQIVQAIGEDPARQISASPITYVGPPQQWVHWKDEGESDGRSMLPLLVQFVPDNVDAQTQASLLKTKLRDFEWVARSWKADESDETIVSDVGALNEPVTQVQLDFIRAVRGAWVYTKDIQMGAPDENGNVIQATEVDHVQTFQGKLYAGLGNWNDSAFAELPLLVPDKVTNLPPGSFMGFYGAMMLVKESADASWKVDHYFGAGTLRVDELTVLELSTDEFGEPLSEPFEILYAGVTDISRLVINTHWRDPSTGEWGKLLLDADATVPPGGAGAGAGFPVAPFVRNYWTAVNSVTGVHEAFVGPATGKIYRGVYDPVAPGYIRWDDKPEFDVDNTSASGRPLTALNINGQNLVGLAGRIFRRDDERGTWSEVLEIPSINPPNDPRGFTAIPAADGNGQEFLTGIFDAYPGLDLCAVLRVDNRSDPLTFVEEVNVRQLKDETYGPAWPHPRRPCFAGYNEFEPHADIRTGRSQHLIGAWLEHEHMLTRAPWNGAFLLTRDVETREYELSLIYDYEEAPEACGFGCELRGVRYFSKSPFPEHEGRVFFTAGFDAFRESPCPPDVPDAPPICTPPDEPLDGLYRNTAWLYRAEWSKDIGY